MSHKITFRERGSGPILILLHGYGGSVNHWEAVAENLKGHYRVVVPNMSHLYMSLDKVLFSVQVESLAEFIRQQFPHQRVCVAGLSFGGAIAWALSLQHPELVEKLALINPMVPDPIPRFAVAELRYFFSLRMNLKMIFVLLATPLGRSFLRRAALVFRDERAEGAVNIETLKGRKLQFVAHMIHHFAWVLRTTDWAYWRQKMQTARAESLLIYDREDLLFHEEHYQNFARNFHCEKVIEMTGAGHLAIKNRPESIAHYILDFFTREKSQSA